MEQMSVSNKPWWRQWWGVVGIAVVLAILVFGAYVGILIWQGTGVSTGSDLAHFSSAGTGITPVQIDRQRLIRETSPSLGPQDAPLTIVEFGDFECPYCGESFPVIRSLLAAYGSHDPPEPGDQIHFVFRQFPVPTLHDHAVAAAEASACAAAQGKFWAYHDRLFLNQTRLDDLSLREYAAESGLDVNQFNSCVSARTFKSLVERDVADGQALGVHGTPTWFFNGRKVEGAIPEDIFRKVIEEMLK